MLTAMRRASSFVSTLACSGAAVFAASLYMGAIAIVQQLGEIDLRCVS
jgi:hypothetical protein